MIAPADTSPPVHVLAEDLVLVDWGPMTMTISVWYGGLARPVMAAKASRCALESLKTLGDFQGLLKIPVVRLPSQRKWPRVVDRAVSAVQRVSGELTPLAAVAGAAADEVADMAARLGGDKVIVNNGGDIALRLDRSETAVVGLRISEANQMIGRLHVRGENGIGGVASSGWSGRSFSPGIADMVTVWAENAALADAAATWIAAGTATDGANIAKTRACDLDPGSPLGNMPITTWVGKLGPSRRGEAMARATVEAKRLQTREKIRGCCIWVQGDFTVLDPEGLLRIKG